MNRKKLPEASQLYDKKLAIKNLQREFKQLHQPVKMVIEEKNGSQISLAPDDSPEHSSKRYKLIMKISVLVALYLVWKDF